MLASPLLPLLTTPRRPFNQRAAELRLELRLGTERASDPLNH